MNFYYIGYEWQGLADSDKVFIILISSAAHKRKC
jgi:hypothetical protein